MENCQGELDSLNEQIALIEQRMAKHKAVIMWLRLHGCSTVVANRTYEVLQAWLDSAIARGREILQARWRQAGTARRRRATIG